VSNTTLDPNGYDMVVFTAPSGAGKTTIVKHLLKKYPEQLSFSISATTRPKRENEVKQKDYYFLSPEEFKQKAADGEFIEYEEVYEDRYYGTLKSEIDRIKAQGKKVVFDIEVNGAQNIKDKYGDRCLVIFVKPPSFRILIQRLTKRGTETPKSLEKRIRRIKKELLFVNTFDLVLLNDKLEITLAEAEQIMESHVLGTKQ
jgi:guanylate kinase